MSGEQEPSAETFFLVKMRLVLGLMSSEANEYQGMTIFSRAAITKYHQQGGLTNTNLSSHSSGG